MSDALPYLTVDEVAGRMRCEHRTVRRAIASGELEAAFIGRRWLIRPQAVEEWFEARRRPRVRPSRRALSTRAEPAGSVARLIALDREAGSG